jgi:hypothetical protein
MLRGPEGPGAFAHARSNRSLGSFTVWNEPCSKPLQLSQSKCKVFAVGTKREKGGEPGTRAYILWWLGKQNGNSGLTVTERTAPLSGINVAEANASIPRKVRFDDDLIGALGFTLFFFMLWLVPAAWGGYHDIRDLHMRDILRRQGQEANGEVTQRYALRSGAVVEYKFSVDSVSYSGSGKIIAGDYRALAPGEKIPIRYLPEDPRVNQPVNWGWFSTGWAMFYFLGLGLMVAMGALFIAGLRKRKLVRMGIVVEGRVTGCTPDRSRFKVYYEFTTEDDVGMEGSTRMSEECEPGSPIPVMYLRSNPKRNDCYLE